MIRTLMSAALALALVSGFSNSASAAAVKLRVLGWYGNQKQSTDIERPFWKDLEKNTKEQVAADFRTIDEIGLKGFKSMRTLRSGAFDIVSFQISFVGGEAPVLMGVDLPGLAFDFDGLRRTVDAYRPVLDANLGEKFNGKLLAAWPYPFQIVFCKGEMKTLADLKGQKIRVSGNLTAELVKQLGGAAVTLAGPEVYQALMQGVVDCAVTGSQFGNANDWFEVAKTQNTAPLGGAGVVLHVIRKEFLEQAERGSAGGLDAADGRTGAQALGDGGGWPRRRHPLQHGKPALRWQARKNETGRYDRKGSGRDHPHSEGKDHPAMAVGLRKGVRDLQK